MRSVSWTAPDQNPVFRVNAIEPRPGRGELLIRVCAASVMPTEVSWYPTAHRPNGEARANAVLGHEFSGVTVAVGEDVGSLEIGRDVFGMNDWFSDGAMADYCTAPFFAVAPKPRCLSYVEAASAPISALTAWQGLFDHGKLQPGERVLIHGGAGAVGSFAIQLARLHGARVATTVSSPNLRLAVELGAGEIIDHRACRFDDYLCDMDLVLDTVGGETLERSWSVLRPGGRLVTVVSTAGASTDPRVKEAFFIVKPDQKQLYRIAELLDSGQLRTIVDTVVPLPQAPEAFVGKVPRHNRGKVVVTVATTDQDVRTGTSSQG